MLLLQKHHQDIPRPDLDLDFRRGPPLDPRVTFTRNGLMTYLGPDGLLKTAAVNEPAFAWNSVRYELQVWEQRANLSLWSEQLNNSVWSKLSSSVTPNAAIAPDGTMTADLMMNTSATVGYVDQFVPMGAGAHTQSFYAKYHSAPILQAYMVGSGIVGETLFNLVAGTVNGPGTITSMPGGWFRCTLTGTVAAGSSNVIRIVNYSNSAGVGTYLWGTQLEERAFPTPYIKTEGSTVTRGADVISMTGTNFSDWYRQDEWTAAVEFSAQGTNTARVLSLLGSGGEGVDDIGLFVNPASGKAVSANVISGGVAVGQINSSVAYSAGQTVKAALSYRAGQLILAANGGGLVTSNVAFTPPAITSLLLGGVTSGAYLNGGIARIRYWRKPMTVGQLQRLSV